MPANEFEKQVQRQLDDLELNPSASVWKKVEEQIRKKRRRRVVVLFFFTAALMLMGYYIYYLLQSDPGHERIHPTIATKNEQTTTEKNSENNPSGDVGRTFDNSNEIKPGSSPNAEPNQNMSGVDNGVNRLQISSSDPSIRKKKDGSNEKQPDATVTGQKKADVLYRSSDNKLQTKDNLAVTVDQPGTSGTPTGIAKTNTPIVQQTDQVNQTDSVMIAVKEPTAINADTLKATGQPKNTNEPIRLAKKKYRIKWGIDASTGITSNRGEVFTLNKSADRAQMSTATLPPAGGGSFISDHPSSIKPGPASRIGVIGELQVSPRSRVSAGIQYFYASNTIKKGALVYTLLPVQQTSSFAAAPVDQVYHGAPQNNYTNSYHFLTVPLEYHWQINKSKKLPIQWDMGLSVNYLLSTNALVFNSSYGGIYYQDKSAFNKVRLSLGTGLSFRLKGKKGGEWTIGPEIYFDTRRLINNSNDAKQYLLYMGINAKFFFPQKKIR